MIDAAEISLRHMRIDMNHARQKTLFNQSSRATALIVGIVGPRGASALAFDRAEALMGLLCSLACYWRFPEPWRHRCNPSGACRLARHFMMSARRMRSPII
jgi:hypothetical protein